MYFWIYFWRGGFDCEWMVRFELPLCRKLPWPSALGVPGLPVTSDLSFFCPPRTAAAIFVFFGLFFFSIAAPRIADDFMVQCGRALLATLRLCESGFTRCPEFTVHGSGIFLRGLLPYIRHVPLEQADLW